MRRLLILSLAALSLVAAGCGGPSKQAKYAAEVNDAITQGFGQSLEGLATDPSSDSLHSAATNLRTLAGTLEQMKAPDDETAGDARTLAQALRGYARSVDETADNGTDLAPRTKLATTTIKGILDDMNEGLR